MKTKPSFVGILFIVALAAVFVIFVGAIASLTAPVIRHCWLQYQHHRMLEERRERFYRELGALMADRGAIA